MLIYILLGAALIALGVYLAYFQRNKTGNALLDIQSMKTSTISDVKEAMADMASISDNYREYVELKGTVTAKTPQKTPFSQKDAAYYTATTYRVYEETIRERDSNGNMRTRTVKHEDRISEEESGEELILTDENGDTITIETVGQGGRFDLVKITDRFEPANNYNTNNFFMNPRRRFQSFGGDFVGGNGRSLLGYRMVEMAFSAGQKLYVLGEAYMNGGVLMIGPPNDKSRQFIVTAKSEEELVKNKESAKKSSLIGGIVCGVIGLIIIIVGFTK
ncbi:MAG: hypothetical protein IJ740_15435 [Ruminococcus sp.]|nr:hypothetical protein [Ruminococcus sp.]